ncbi:hypothetical protein EVAR_99020_1 [Eumeta japonica]|uniref:Uncharacterized protein n=1 Tax=Eumeta variegata TaxID=151549 RepID=A0A4C1XZU1_EUMVA|nr:hypothetical protein EVAR_99020_1 [Eumeta japonica]
MIVSEHEAPPHHPQAPECRILINESIVRCVPTVNLIPPCTGTISYHTTTISILNAPNPWQHNYMYKYRSFKSASTSEIISNPLGKQSISTCHAALI